jgi:hypothetical protein
MMMRPRNRIWRTLVAGLAGGVAFVLGTFVTFRLLGGSRIGAEGVLFDPDTQHPKVIAVWKEMEPLPRIMETPVLILAGMLVFGIAYAFVYRSIAAAWPVGLHRRAVRLAFVVWLGTVFAESMGPFNVLELRRRRTPPVLRHALEPGQVRRLHRGHRARRGRARDPAAVAALVGDRRRPPVRARRARRGRGVRRPRLRSRPLRHGGRVRRRGLTRHTVSTRARSLIRSPARAGHRVPPCRCLRQPVPGRSATRSSGLPVSTA